MKAGTMRLWKKFLGIALVTIAVLMLWDPRVFLKILMLILTLPSAYFLIFTGRQGG